MNSLFASRPYWVKREKRGVWHLAESWVAGDAITYCGRRMRDGQTADGVLITLALTPIRDICRMCGNGGFTKPFLASLDAES